MDWARMLAYVTGTVDQELLTRNEYLAAENRIIKAQLKGRLKLSDAERVALGEMGRLLNLHANRCVAAVLQQGTLAKASHSVSIHSAAIAEAFPNSFLGMMIEQPTLLQTRRGNRSDVYFDHLASGDV